MERVSVVGSSGAGKSTLAAALAARLQAPHVELDALFHGPGWTAPDRDDFRERVAAALPPDGRWVADGNYRSWLDGLVLDRADTVVFVDVPRWRAMAQLVHRTLRRAVLREELWNGNRERLGTLLSRDPQRNLLLWAWRRHPRHAEDWETLQADPALTSTRLVRVRTRDEARRLVADVV